jgi:glutathione S-transferase
MRTLWGRASSSNVMKVIWLLEELALPYRRIDCGGPFGGTDAAEYRAMNPTGLVPVLQEDGFALWESNAILRYLAGQAPPSPIWPVDARARANADCWMDAQQTMLGPFQTVVFQGLVRTAPERRDAAAIRAAAEKADAAWLLVDGALSRGGPFICSASLTLADIAWGVHAHRWFNMDVERSEAPALRAWYDRLLERPAYAAHCAGPVV